VAITLNLIFRLGTRKTARLVLAPSADATARVHAFCEEQGGAWGARRDVMQRVTAALAEFAEISSDVVERGREAVLELSFDEFHVGAAINYPGRALVRAADDAPAPAASLEEAELPTDISRRIIRRMADKFASGRDGEMQWLKLDFDH